MNRNVHCSVLCRKKYSAADVGRLADFALLGTQTHRLVPLRWALACLLAGVGSATHSPAEVAAICDRSATFITRHGGRWNSR